MVLGSTSGLRPGYCLNPLLLGRPDAVAHTWPRVTFSHVDSGQHAPAEQLLTSIGALGAKPAGVLGGRPPLAVVKIEVVESGLEFNRNEPPSARPIGRAAMARRIGEQLIHLAGTFDCQAQNSMQSHRGGETGCRGRFIPT